MKLKKINLKKGNGHNHPDIKIGRTKYLAKIGGALFVGSFRREWYGLFFDGWNHRGIQFDTPGTNSSTWESLWQIIR